MSSEWAEIFNKHCKFERGFPYPEWDAVYAWSSDRIREPELDLFWRAVASLWVDKIVERLGDGYRRYESDEFTVVTSEPENVAKRMLVFCEEKLRQVLEILDGIAFDAGYGKRVVLHFPSSDIYWEYVAEFMPEEECSEQAGVFLSRGYGHIAVTSEYYWFTETVILHELAHGCLMHLPLPLWLNEGLAKFVELRCGFTSPLLLDAERAQKHREIWNETTIQSYWSGESFTAANEYSEMSYELSEILMNLIADEICRGELNFANFVNDASWEDCGEAAAQKHLSKSLADILSRFLGPGNWTPLPLDLNDESDAEANS